MKKKYRVKKNSDFQAVFSRNKSMANRQFVIYILEKNKQTFFRAGLSVSKKLGNAVMRNKIKRYIRQFFLEEKENIKIEVDYIVIARKPVTEMSSVEVKNSLKHVFIRAGCYSEKSKG